MGEKAGRRKDEEMEAEGVTVEAVQKYSGRRSRSCKESAIASPCDKRWSCHYDSACG